MNDLIKQLHNLSQTSSERELKSSLTEIVSNIQTVLNIDNKLYCNLDLSCSLPDNDISFTLFIRESDHDSSDTLTTPKVLKLLEKYQIDELNKTHTKHKTIQIQNNKIKILKEPFKAISQDLNELVRFFNELHKESEFKLINYITNCFEHELKFHKSLENHLLNLDPNQKLAIKNDQLVNILKSLYNDDKDEKSAADQAQHEDEDSIFTYQTIDFIQPNQLPIKSDWEKFKFVSNDLDLKQLYDNLLLILFLPDISHNSNKILNFSKVLITLFKSIKKIEFFEVNSFHIKESKFNRLFQFLVNFIPTQFLNSFNDFMLTIHFFPEFDESNNTITRINTRHQPDDLDQVLEQNARPEDEINEYQAAESNSNVEFQTSVSPPTQFKQLIIHLKDIIHELNELNLNIKFDVNFPKVFKLYLKKLESYNIDLENDSYCIAVSQLVAKISNGNAVQTDEELEDDILKLYNYCILLSTDLSKIPDNCSLIMRESILEFKQKEKILTTFLHGFSNKYKSKVQLDDHLRIWELYLLKSYLKKWFNKLCKNKLLYEKSIEFHNNYKQYQILKLKWLKKLNQIEKLKTVSAKIDMGKFFANWVNKVEIYEKLRIVAESHYETNLTERTFKNKFLVISKIDKLSELYDEIILKFYIFIWKRKHQIVDELNNKQSELILRNSTNLSSVFFKHWKEKTSVKFPEIVDLNSVSNKFIMNKFFSKWKSANKLFQIENQVLENNDKILSKFILDSWSKRLSEKSILADIQAAHLSQLKETTFHNWKQSTEFNLAAGAFDAHRLVFANFKQWILKHKQVNLETQLDAELIVDSFRVWKLKLRLVEYERVRYSIKLSEVIRSWSNKVFVSDKSTTEADEFNKQSTLKIFFNSWRKLSSNNRHLSETADLQYVSKVWSLMKLRFDQVQRYQSKAEDFNSNRSIKVFLDKWVESYETKFNLINEVKVQEFQNKVNSNLLLRSLIVWEEQFNTLQDKKDSLDFQESQFNSEYIRNNVFSIWRSKTTEITDLQKLSDEFNENYLLKKHLLKWFNFYLYNEEMVGKANEFKADVDIKELEKRLSVWSMKFLKNTRNIQSCEFFIERWDLAKARGILNLWKHKIDEKLAPKDNSINDSQIFYNQNSDVSPLANRPKIYSNDNESYLDTPLKRNDEQGAATPLRFASTSRLSATAERMKKDRLDALKEHYRKAKVRTSSHVSPIRAIDELKVARSNSDSRLATSKRTYTRLSPPKKNTELPFRRSPPKQPVFFNNGNSGPSLNRLPSPTRLRPDTNLSNVTEVSRDREDETRSQRVTDFPNPIGSNLLTFPRLPSPNYDTDAIETAKKLRRITPIFVPSNEEEPKFSPVKKLKERARLNISFQDAMQNRSLEEGDFRLNKTFTEPRYNYTSTPMHNRYIDGFGIDESELNQGSRASDGSNVTDKLKAALDDE